MWTQQTTKVLSKSASEISSLFRDQAGRTGVFLIYLYCTFKSHLPNTPKPLECVVRTTGLEPATSAVTALPR